MHCIASHYVTLKELFWVFGVGVLGGLARIRSVSWFHYITLVFFDKLDFKSLVNILFTYIQEFYVI